MATVALCSYMCLINSYSCFSLNIDAYHLHLLAFWICLFILPVAHAFLFALVIPFVSYVHAFVSNCACMIPFTCACISHYVFDEQWPVSNNPGYPIVMFREEMQQGSQDSEACDAFDIAEEAC